MTISPRTAGRAAKLFFYRIRPPCGKGVRVIIGVDSVLLGVIYLNSMWLLSGDVYVHQAGILPHWGYGLILLLGSIALLATLPHRLSRTGRATAVFMCGGLTLFAFTFWPMPTSIITYLVLAWGMYGEAGAPNE